MQINFKRLRPDAVMPVYATPGSAAADIAVPHSMTANLLPKARTMVPTGLAFEPPQGYAVFMFSRSGLAKQGICLANGVAVIDSDYRGELMACLYNDQGAYYPLVGGTRFAQIVCLPVEQAQFLEVETLSETIRGAGGFGSTGARS